MKTIILLAIFLIPGFLFSQEITVKVDSKLKDCKIENIPEGKFSRITWEYKDSIWKSVKDFPEQGRLLIVLKLKRKSGTYIGFLPFYYSGQDAIFNVKLEKTKNKNYEKNLNHFSFDDFFER